MSSREDVGFEEAAEERRLIDLGLLEPGQPTWQAHRRHVRKMEAEFTPLERRLIRGLLFGGAREEED